MDSTMRRIVIDLSDFFDDIRKSSYISVDICEDTLIESLIPRIQTLFEIGDNLSFTIDGHFISNLEKINMLRENDVLKVHQVDFLTNSSKKIKKKRKKEKSSNDDIKTEDTENDDIPIKKKKKLEKNDQPNVNDDKQININSMNEIINSKKSNENSLIENKEEIIEKKQINHNLNQTLETSLNITNEDLMSQCSSTGKKKRKRKRKRKSKIDNGIAATCNMIRSLGADVSNSNSNKMEFSKESKIENKNNHLRFSSDSEEDTTATISNSHPNHNKSQDSENQMDIDVFASVMKKEQSSDSITVTRVITKINGEKEKSKESESYDEYPILDETPKENMMIAFKFLKLNENYCPQVSKYIKARVISFCTKIFEIKLQILDGIDQFKKPKGKFHNENLESDIVNKEEEEEVEEEKESSIKTLNWNELRDIKFIKYIE